MDNLSGDIRFKNVYFSYNGKEEVLKGVDFQIDQGQTVALVGPSGAGKTTIANLLCRFYEPQRGSITIDGVNIYDIKLKSLRKNIAVVTQETFLFNASILDNIKYSHRKASLEEVIYAAHLANLHEFIQSLPHGYDTVIGDRGVKLSGGQKQRIAIARAILRNPSILILDEATSSLDSESERLIQEALENFMKGRTTLVIAHRLSTVVNADKIIVLDQGRVLGQGGHEELYLSNSLYRKLCDEQFGESNKVLRKESLAV